MPSSPDPRPPIFFEILCGLLLSSYLPILHPGPQGIGEMPSSPDPRPPIFFEILCGLLLSSSANKSDRDGLGHVLPFSIPACQGRPPIFFEISGCIARFFLERASPRRNANLRRSVVGRMVMSWVPLTWRRPGARRRRKGHSGGQRDGPELTAAAPI